MFRILALLLALALPLPAAQKPNIIFILTDDMGWGDYGMFFQNLRKEKGDRSEPWHMTPQLDKMAAEGIQFPHHYCPAPVCAPSRASLLLGVHQGHSTIRDNQFDKALPKNHTIATVLQGAGYSTAAIGKWGLQGGNEKKPKESSREFSPKDWPGYPTKHGFDFFHGYVRHVDGHYHYPLEDGKEVWENEKEISANLKGCYTTDLFTARASKWISDQHAATPEKPFFLYLAYDTPHAKTQVAAKPFPKEGLKWTGEKGNAINTADGTPNSYIHPDYAEATWDHDKNADTPEVAWPDVYQRYASMVRRIDDCVGDLIRTLKELGIDDNTLIVFTTDNGPSNESYLDEKLKADFFNSFGEFDGIKRDVTEGGIRVGAVLRWPGGTAPIRLSNLPSQFHDWLPTFANLAGVAAPAAADGTSLAPTITGNGEQKEPQVYIEYLQPNQKTPNYPEFEKDRQGQERKQMQAIRFGDHIGVRYRIKSHSDPFEIYNVVSDPKQTENLAAEMPDLQEKMHDAVLRMRMPNNTAPRPYDSEKVPAISPDSILGLGWSAYESHAPWLPRLDDIEPLEKGISGQVENIEITGADSLLFSGFLAIPSDGAYTFLISEGATAVLRIHDATVIDSGFSPAGKEKEGTIILAKGKHPIRFYWKNGETDPSLEISADTMSRQAIPGTMLSH